MSAPEQFDADLKQQFQHDKAQHLMPASLRKDILRQAKRNKKRTMPVIWRNMQLALCCALLVVFSTVLLPARHGTGPQYYKIVYSSNSEFREVQQHSITEEAVSAGTELKEVKQSQYMAMAKQTASFHLQVGLLRQEQQQWQISVCDELLLKIDKALLAQLDLPLETDKFAAEQWVEFSSDQHGQLIAIKPATTALRCPAV